MAKQARTLKKENTLRRLYSLDQKYKMNNSNWNDSVKKTFAESGSFCFENLVQNNLAQAELLAAQFN